MAYRLHALYGAILVVLVSSTDALAGPAGQAQAADSAQPKTPAAAAPQASAAKTLDAVVVTGTKRVTPLQKTPVAISAINAETLGKERVMTVQDITKLVPSMQATRQGDHDVITVTLRGIGNDQAKTEYADPEVAIFVDGVYSPRAEAAAGLLLDIESAEVLRGPQGTLWGRNSTVGAVNFQTTKPEIGSYFGNAQLSVGNYNAIGARAAVNLPISDTFAMRVAFVQEQHDGYVDYQNPTGQLPSVDAQRAAYAASGGDPALFQPINPNLFVTRGDKYNAQDQSAARVSALWQPNEAFSWNLALEYFRDRGTPSMNLMQKPRAGQDFWSALIDTAPYIERDGYALRSRMDWDLNDGMRLSYIAGFSRLDGASTYDQDSGVQVPTSFTTGATFQEDRTNGSKYKSSSHEFNLASTGTNTLDWIVGLYYATENNSMRFDIPLFNGTQQGTVGWQGSFIQPKETVDSYAGFGQLTWNVNDAWRLTAGARYTDDQKQNVGGRGWGWAYNPAVPQVPISTGTIPGPGNGFNVSTVNDGKYSHNQTTWLLRTDFDVGKNGLVYASVSTGYKSGGLQDGGATFGHEELTNYEVGGKFSFMEGRLVWNSALYYMDFKDFQLSAPVTFPDGNRGLGFNNVAGSTKVWGYESELSALIGGNDRLNLTVSGIPKKELGTLLYAGSNDYQGLPACPPVSGISNCMNVSGNELPHAPDFALTLMWEHDFHLGNGGTLTPRFTAHYETESWLSVFNLGNEDRQKAYGRGDISLRYEEPERRWWASAYVQNVTDEKTRTAAGRFNAGDGQYLWVSQYLPPLTYGMSIGLNF
ncbi:TonB-dependent receptor [Lysobacter capsici]|uniref:TonB-dependent receptor n=1 Tax=Lysobacter capsici TaxID=435897 RepID=UPI00177CA604|nr:TonB-dependent receptor [Lysobacter capsici]UOF14465.1 TonB-dependent receptor [Lysobacter capsici]